ncbi:MAG: hypothetical protein AB7P03_05830 [Kofleriaceae bacterium]
MALLLVVAGCQRGETNQPPLASAPNVGTAPAASPTEYTEYKADIEALCDVIQRSGAGEDDARTLTTANWLAANLKTQESRKFLVKIQPVTGIAKAEALETEAKRVGLSGCALAQMWRDASQPSPNSEHEQP